MSTRARRGRTYRLCCSVAGLAALVGVYVVRQRRRRAILDSGLAERNRVENELHAMRERTAILESELSAIVKSSGDPIVSCDLEGTILTWNHAAEELFGWTAEESIGQKIALLAPPERKGESKGIFATVIERKVSIKVSTQRATKDGRLLDVEISISPVFDPAGRMVGVAGIIRDLTERRHAEAERESLIEKRAELLRLNELFVGVLGHDLRNPLGSIRVGADLVLRRAMAPPEDLRAIERVQSSAARMARMIDQILDFTRGRENVAFTLARHPLCLEAAARRVIDELELVHPSARLHLEVEGDTRGAWDEDRILQLLSNLVGNAIEHGGDEPVVVRVVGAARSVEVDVHNRGAPIPSEVMGSLFEPFHRTRSVPRSGGLGLGLFIVRAIVAAHGGEIHVTSSAEEGTSFVVTLPRA